jgi:hypothetical protein
LRTPNARLTAWFVSARTGCVISCGKVFRSANQALCEKNESVLTPMIAVPSSLKSPPSDWKPLISVGADEREVERVPVEDVPLALEVLVAERLLLAVHVRDRAPGGLGFANHVLFLRFGWMVVVGPLRYRLGPARQALPPPVRLRRAF